MELKAIFIGTDGYVHEVLIVPFMELKVTAMRAAPTRSTCLNRTFYGIESSFISCG